MSKILRFLQPYWVLVFIFIILAFLPGFLHIWWTTLWLYQPLFSIFCALLATQIGTMVAKNLFQDAVRRMSEELSPENEDTEKIRSQKEQLQRLIKERANSNKDANDALESFLSQVVGAWAAVILTVGNAFILFLRKPLTGIENPSWAPWAVGIICGVLMGWIVFLNATNALTAKSVLHHYGRTAWYPPSGRLTSFRIAALVSYSALVIILSWPPSPTQVGATQPQPTNLATKVLGTKLGTNGLK